LVELVLRYTMYHDVKTRNSRCEKTFDAFASRREAKCNSSVYLERHEPAMRGVGAWEWARVFARASCVLNLLRSNR